MNRAFRVAAAIRRFPREICKGPPAVAFEQHLERPRVNARVEPNTRHAAEDGRTDQLAVLIRYVWSLMAVNQTERVETDRGCPGAKVASLEQYDGVAPGAAGRLSCQRAHSSAPHRRRDNGPHAIG